MKGIFKNFARIAFALTIGAVALNSCSKDDDDDKNKKGDNGASKATSQEAFYNGYVNNKATTILVDIRSAADFKASHIKDAINIDCESDQNWYMDNKFPVYDSLKVMDPMHEKYIQLYGSNGMSPISSKVASTISGMGWGANKVFMLTGKYEDFAKKYPTIIEK